MWGGVETDLMMLSARSRMSFVENWRGGLGTLLPTNPDQNVGSETGMERFKEYLFWSDHSACSMSLESGMPARCLPGGRDTCR